MKRTYTQLNQEQRYQISALLKAGCSQQAVAEELGVHKSTISREMQRNRGARGYRPLQAHDRAMRRRRERASTPRINAATWAVVEDQLQEQWSPEQIAGRLLLEHDELPACTQSGQAIGCVSHERIYQYIYDDKAAGGTLHVHLRCQKKRRKRYGSGRSRRGQIANRTCISQRPRIVEKRCRLGDWEGDTIVGKGHQKAIVTLTERFSRFTLLKRVDRSTAKAVSKAMREKLQGVTDKVLTITLDNGKEFSHHGEVAAALNADVFFAHPYSSWERGLNENTNGLVRQYCPKKSDFTQYDEEYIQAIEDQINHRPRKILNYRTPFEIFFQEEYVALTT